MPQDELESLMKQVVPFAEQMLLKHREFSPYGAFLTTTGEVELISADDSGEPRVPQELIQALVAGFRKHAKTGKYKATALVALVRVWPPGTDEKMEAIRVSLEHTSGLAMDVFLPYHVDGQGQIQYGEIFASRGDKTVFGNADGAD